MTDTANSQSARFMKGEMLRNLVAGLVARACHKTTWLLRPRQIPKHPIGNLRRKGHFSSFGRSISS